MKRHFLTLILFTVQCAIAHAEPSAIWQDDFSSETLSEEWTTNFGDWSVNNGILTITQQAGDNHGASGRRQGVFRDGEVTVRFRVPKDSSGFTLSFDPHLDETEKVGALHSLIIRPHIWRIQRGANKRNLKAEPAATLAEAKIKLPKGAWLELKATLQGERVTFSLPDIPELTATDPSFAIRKSAVVFKTPHSIELDQVEVAPLSATASSAKTRPFFAFQNGMRNLTPPERIELLKELGYDGIGSASPADLESRLPLYDEAELKLFSLYLGMEATVETYQLKPGVVDSIQLLRGRGETTVIELFIQGERDNPAVRKQAIAGVREVARLANDSGLRIVLYPHTGQHIDTVGRAFDLARTVDRLNVGVMFNLCHFLRVEPDSDLRETLTNVNSHLWRVSTSGAEAGGNDWGQLIQPLDSGSFSQKAFFDLLDDIGYHGPVGLQCFGIKAAPRDHLSRSMTAWREL